MSKQKQKEKDLRLDFAKKLEHQIKLNKDIYAPLFYNTINHIHFYVWIDGIKSLVISIDENHYCYNFYNFSHNQMFIIDSQRKVFRLIKAWCNLFPRDKK